MDEVLELGNSEYYTPSPEYSRFYKEWGLIQSLLQAYTMHFKIPEDQTAKVLND
jgi:hypothetical protein